MFRKLIHHRPFFRKPPFEDPRELGERYPKEPILEDYWIKPYILEALKNYPRLNDSCVVEGLWTFANSILLKNYKAVKRVPPTFDDPEVTHKIAFLDKEDVELGAIKFWRKVDSTFGIDVKLGNGGISIVGDNDNPTMSLVNTPVNDSPKEIVNVEYLNQAFSSFTSRLDELVNRIQALEDLYDDHVKPLITDPNDNYRGVHTTIHADASDNNLPTCGAVYQYGKDISDALNERINNLPGSTTVNDATTSSKGIMQVGSNLTVNNGVVGVDTVDQVQDGNMHPVTSNAVADELSSIREALDELSGGSDSSSSVLPEGVDGDGNETTFNENYGWRIWIRGKLAVIHVPAEISSNMSNNQSATITLPVNVAYVVYKNVTLSSTQRQGGSGVDLYNVQISGTTLTVVYTGGSGNSPGQSKNPNVDIICFIN